MAFSGFEDAYTLICIERGSSDSAWGVLVTPLMTVHQFRAHVKKKSGLTYPLQLSCEGHLLTDESLTLAASPACETGKVVLIENMEKPESVTKQQLGYFSAKLKKLQAVKAVAAEVEEAKAIIEGERGYPLTETEEADLRDRLQKKKEEEEDRDKTDERPSDLKALRLMMAESKMKKGRQKKVDWAKWEAAYNSDDDLEEVQEKLKKNLIGKHGAVTDYEGWDKWDPEADEDGGDEMEEMKAQERRKITALAAASCKAAGNDAFKSKSYPSALREYCAASLLDPKNAVYFSNAAQAYLLLKEWKAADAAASGAIRLDKSNVKALMRRAKARLSYRPITLEHLHGARNDLREASRLEPKAKGSTLAKQIIKLLQKVQLEEDKVKSGFYS